MTSENPDGAALQLEGVLRAIKLLPDGRPRSSAVYSILDREWPDVERALTDRIARGPR